MTSSNSSTEQGARTPGVRYRKVKLTRPETTVIDGVASTRYVTYTGWEEKPARDWDALVLRGLIGITITFTGVAVTGTTASVGGLLAPLVPQAIAYAMASVFPVAWLYCLGIEWLNRTTPERARPAQVGGWITLALSMAAVVVYGVHIHQEAAGAFGGGLDLLAKTFWLLLLREYAVPLNPGIAHWVNEQEQHLTARQLLATRLQRLGRRAAYQQAVGGVELQAAEAMLRRAATPPLQQAPAEPEPEPAPAASPATPVSSAVPASSVAPAAPVQAPAAPPAAPAQAATPAPAAPPVAPAAPAQPAAPAPQPPAGPVPPIRQIAIPPIASICREQITANPRVTDADLYTAVLAAGHPNRPSLADTVRRTAQRVDPTRKTVS